MSAPETITQFDCIICFLFFHRNFDRHVFLFISANPSKHYGFKDELEYLIGFKCVSASGSPDMCSRPLGSVSFDLFFKVLF